MSRTYFIINLTQEKKKKFHTGLLSADLSNLCFQISFGKRECAENESGNTETKTNKKIT